ncbi:hypothetical protein C2G38_2241172 [Gigaspora rosea]|uniref:Helicase C-terminal domain-containing protein n=1 Tax=Gigaspora rosea TaxID=44941 RepID=A0A397VVG8_9GLOM|nr:hypothetical protein C2G38_2241172 [Gigaspora rosea]
MTAFGMGLNVNDVRAVIHTTFPMSIDALVQETGCTGRDGIAAKNPGDLPIVECNNCDNCDHQKKDDTCWYNVEMEARRMETIQKREEAKYLLEQLILHGVIQHQIELKRIRPESSILSYSRQIVNVSENSEHLLVLRVWRLLLRKRKGE